MSLIECKSSCVLMLRIDKTREGEYSIKFDMSILYKVSGTTEGLFALLCRPIRTCKDQCASSVTPGVMGVGIQSCIFNFCQGSPKSEASNDNYCRADKAGETQAFARGGEVREVLGKETNIVHRCVCCQLLNNVAMSPTNEVQLDGCAMPQYVTLVHCSAPCITPVQTMLGEVPLFT